MRLFLAIEIPKEVRGHLAILQERLQSRYHRVKWVNCGLLHITLKFLGEVREGHLAKVIAIAQEVAGRWGKPPVLAMGTAGAFPPGQKARVLWVGLSQGEKELSTLAGELEQGFASQGFRKEQRSWVPHITLGRSREGVNVQDSDEISSIAAETIIPQQWLAGEFLLMQSILSRKGPTYTCLRRFSLRKE